MRLERNGIEGKWRGVLGWGGEQEDEEEMKRQITMFGLFEG